MIEITLYEYLKQKFKGKIPVHMEYPDHPEKRFFLLSRTGGGMYNQIPSAVFTLQSYGVSLADSAKMNLQGMEAMLNAVELDSVADVKLNSDYNFTDTTRKRHRYQAVFNITHYERSD